MMLEQAITEPVLQISLLLWSGVLVIMMAMGMVCYQAGMVRSKNVATVMTSNLTCFAITLVVMLWFGLLLIYGVPRFSVHHFPSSLENLHGGVSFLFYQTVLPFIAISIFLAATVERIKLWACIIFAIVFAALIYPVVAHWVWGGGFLQGLGYMDVAGASVVHLTGAVAGLAAVILLGARQGRFPEKSSAIMTASNLPFSVLGTFFIWLGCLGFNSGNIIAAAGDDWFSHFAIAMLNSNLSMAASLLATLLIVRIWFGRNDLSLLLNGAVAGLVAVSAGPMLMTFFQAIILGTITGALVSVSIIAVTKLRIDDPLGAISVHGCGAVTGLLFIAFLKNDAHGWSFLLGREVLGIVVISLWVFIISFLVLLIIKLLIGIRISHSDEQVGSDILEIGMRAYPEFDR